MLNDSHCHFFSTGFFTALGRGLKDANVSASAPHEAALSRLGWDAPGTDAELADRWVRELDARKVSRAALIASVPGDEASVAAAVQRHPERFVGFFMVDPTRADAHERAAAA